MFTIKCRHCDHAKSEHLNDKGKCSLCWAAFGKCMKFRAPPVGFKPRSAIRAVSPHRARINRLRAKAMRRRFGPRPWHCQVARIVNPYEAHPCVGQVDGHEVLKRSRAGSTDENLLNMDGILLCCVFHNSWIEDHPILANSLGLAHHHWEATK